MLFKNFHEKFFAAHQSAVLFIGLAVIVISPGGDYISFAPFVIAIAPIFFAAFAQSHAKTESGGGITRLRTYALSSLVGVLCALVLMGMWFVWAIMETFRAMASAG